MPINSKTTRAEMLERLTAINNKAKAISFNLPYIMGNNVRLVQMKDAAKEIEELST